MTIALSAVCAEALVIAITMLLGLQLAHIREARAPARLEHERRELERLLRGVREGASREGADLLGPGTCHAAARGRTSHESLRPSRCGGFRVRALPPRP
jgi:hypothetical protein